MENFPAHWSVEQVMAQGRFTPLPSPLLTAGYTQKIYWLRLTLDQLAINEPSVLHLPPAYLDDVQVYVPKEKN